MMNAPTLIQAREALIELGHQRIVLTHQVQEQKRKIYDLEREVQVQAAAAEKARALLADARQEIEALRAQLPDDATYRAYGALVEVLTTSSQEGLRIAA
jgi:septal ring factor EnvC (AmiA/AmiB activator)